REVQLEELRAAPASEDLEAVELVGGEVVGDAGPAGAHDAELGHGAGRGVDGEGLAEVVGAVPRREVVAVEVAAVEEPAAGGRIGPDGVEGAGRAVLEADERGRRGV